YAVWQKSKAGSPTHSQYAVQHAQFAKPSSRIRRQPEAKPNQAPENANASTGNAAILDQTQPDEAHAGFTLELSATERAWLSIIADGKPSFRGILEKAETKILEGHRTARIRTGNAGGVEVVFNGKPLGVLGRRGQIRTVLFTKNNYEVLQGPSRVSLVEFNQSAELKLPLDFERSPAF